MRAIVFALFAASCTYDYGRIPRGDAGMEVDARGAFVCDPFSGGGCSPGTSCAAFVDSAGSAAIRCAVPGRVALSGPCDGTGQCEAGLVCLSTGGGSASCRPFCTDTTACPGSLTCDATRTLFADGPQRAHPCL